LLGLLRISALQRYGLDAYMELRGQHRGKQWLLSPAALITLKLFNFAIGLLLGLMLPPLVDGLA